MPWPSISAARSPTSSPTITTDGRSSTPRARPPTAISSKASSIVSPRPKLEPRAANFVNHGTTLVINSLIQRKGAKAALVTTARLPRRARDRARQPARSVRPALSARRAADPARAALRGDRAHRQQGRDRHAARHGGAGAARGRSLKALGIEAVAIFFMNSYANPAHEEQAAAISARAAARTSTSPVQHRADARMVRVRAHLDRRRQRLCRAAGEPLRPAAREAT